MTREQFEKRVVDLFAKAIFYNRDDFSIFVHFSGHVKSISFDCHYGGWKANKSASFLFGFYTDSDDPAFLDGMYCYEGGQKTWEKIFDEYEQILDAASEENDQRKIKAQKDREDRELKELERLQEKYPAITRATGGKDE